MAEIEGQMELPLGRGGWLNGRKFEMPAMGLVRGHVQARLYRGVDLDGGSAKSPESGGLGLHWSHDLEAVKEYTKNMERPKIIEAVHPGYDHLMDPDNPKHHDLLETTVVAKKFLSEATPAEVPVLPGTSMRVLATHHLDRHSGEFKRRKAEFEGKA